MNSPRSYLTLLAAVCVLLLSACRLDVDVAVEMAPDGTGTVTVEAVADAELVEQTPDLMTDLRLDDAIDAGWSVDGPTETDNGGARVVLTHPFASEVELANLLNSIGAPLTDVRTARTVGDDQTTNAIDATLGLPNGYESFADSDLIDAAGGLPFGDRIEASGLAPQDAFSFTFEVELPGELVQAPTATDSGGVYTWEAPLDGSNQQIRVETAQQTGSGAEWAGPVAKVAKYAFYGWCALAVLFIAFVAVARRRKASRRGQALQSLNRHTPPRRRRP